MYLTTAADQNSQFCQMPPLDVVVLHCVDVSAAKKRAQPRRVTCDLSAQLAQHDATRQHQNGPEVNYHGSEDQRVKWQFFGNGIWRESLTNATNSVSSVRVIREQCRQGALYRHVSSAVSTSPRWTVKWVSLWTSTSSKPPHASVLMPHGRRKQTKTKHMLSWTKVNAIGTKSGNIYIYIVYEDNLTSH